jgi:adenosyl cobinamide kinase/adenosyl cobinamide phosphate guanylyltransferase
LAEGLPCDKKGIIFIGNTRAGKSTLALAMAGAAMKVVYGCGELTYLNPSDKAFKDIVRNTHQSVTERPNFYPRR